MSVNLNIQFTVFQVDNKLAAECTLVDHGGRFSIELSNLRRLLPEYEMFAHQGVRCALMVRVFCW